MSDIAIRVESLGKQYRIGKRERYRTFRDTLADAFIAPFKRTYGLLRGNASSAANLNETIWALRDVSFEVKKGEVIGIIGRNGAGKSTLLKILARIAEPTEGQIQIRGRVGALLEVGTGFHQELTGRENIYLNAAILGMKRVEINRKFDEIIAFAEVEKFLDTPVKYYSSGMGLRLGFAVAAHLEPEILIVDEVLAVGDIDFQRKCLGKMQGVASEGRTVLFVSHDLRVVQTLCPRVVLLANGNVIRDDLAGQVIAEYLDAEIDRPHFSRLESSTQIDGIQLTSIRVFDNQGNLTNNIRAGDPISIEMNFVSDQVNSRTDFEINFSDIFQRRLAIASTSLLKEQHPNVNKGQGSVRLSIPSLAFVPGDYSLGYIIGSRHHVFDIGTNIMRLHIIANDSLPYNSYAEQQHGPLLIHPIAWEYNY